MVKSTKTPQEATRKKRERIKHLDKSVAGLDIGASSIFACIALHNEEQEVREYAAFTADLKQMALWFKENRIKSVAMESTGVYWIPAYEILEEEGFEVLLVNAHHVKNVPGRKTDVKDCQWIQELHSCGLLRGSFRPANEILGLRSYARQRTKLFECAAMQMQLMHKALSQMNIQLNLVISNITGATGMKIIKAILCGERDPTLLSRYRDPRCKKKEEEIAKALEGNFREEHLFSLKQALEAYEFFQDQIMKCEKEIETNLATLKKEDNKGQKPAKTNVKTSYRKSPYFFDAATALKEVIGVDITEIPGIDANLGVRIISEIGTDMSRWKNAKHFVSWLGLCPGNKISGGKVLNSKTKPTNNRAAQGFRLAANALRRMENALGAFFRRMSNRLGPCKAITAAANKLAKILYRMVRNKEEFRELGKSYYEERYRCRVISNLKKKASEFGYELIEKRA